MLVYPGAEQEGKRGEQMIEAGWFAGRLIEIRTGLGLSRKQLAEKAGLKAATGIRDIEQGKRLPGWEMVVALCNALSIDCGAFMRKPAGEHKLKAGRPPRSTGGAAGPKRKKKDKP
jgi:DNA-binding XRE family transcriptional regulator